MYRYWGKAKKDEESYHLLVYHSLDVAAVGSILLTQHPTLLQKLSHLTGLPPEQFKQWMVFFLALHDIGKFADCFQNLRPDLLKLLQNRESNRQYSERHDTLGYLLWKETLKPHFVDLNIMPEKQGKWGKIPIEEDLIDCWMGAVTGHHGMPPKNIGRTRHQYFEDDLNFRALTAYTTEIYTLFGNNLPFPKMDLNKLELASWWLSGFAVLCDWLGSNQDYFPYCQQKYSLTDYWEIALKQAEDAILSTGLLTSKVRDCLTLNDIIKTTDKITATPLQKIAQNITLTDSPHLLILEDVTGAGKTEAAVILAHRLMQQPTINGVYFALPTMATANAMYQRMAKAYRAFYHKDSLPSLVLAHGASALSKQFRQSILPINNQVKTQHGDGTDTAEAHCNQWLTDNRKKSLLADIGVGTIDQALLAILPARHQSLRLLGLLNKVLIVDEVHACDTYMHILLCRLLTAHALAGGSVILLSATLAKTQRQQFINAYNKGRKVKQQPITKTGLTDYPLITRINDQEIQEKVIATRQSVKRTIKTAFIHDKQEIEALFSQTIKNKQCACWIRNTVIDAYEAYDWLTKAHPDWDIDLFHARFAMGDRLDIENRVLAHFGEKSTAQQRQGKIIIATQVVEQSLDVDWDYMITDLVPIDLIIQRAGRLCRHIRDALGNRIKGDDQRGQAVLHIYSPPLTDSPQENWVADFFQKAKYIYPNHGQLWLTAQLLNQKGQFKMPEDARALIEGVYSEEAEEDIPDALLNTVWETEGANKANASLANKNALKLECGYKDIETNCWWDKAKTPTRLGEDTRLLYLARWIEGEIIPWYNTKEHAWAYSSVSIRSYLVDQEQHPNDISNQQIDACKTTLPAKGKWGILVILQENEGLWCGQALNEAGEQVKIEYDEVKGLVVLMN